MTTWPSSNKAVTTTTDQASDTISGAREGINKTISNVNDIIDIFNIPSSPTDNYILKYNASTGVFDMEADSGGSGSGVSLEQVFARYSFNNDFHLTFGRQLSALGFEQESSANSPHQDVHR